MRVSILIAKEFPAGVTWPSLNQHDGVEGAPVSQAEIHVQASNCGVESSLMGLKGTELTRRTLRGSEEVTGQMEVAGHKIPAACL